MTIIQFPVRGRNGIARPFDEPFETWGEECERLGVPMFADEFDGYTKPCRYCGFTDGMNWCCNDPLFESRDEGVEWCSCGVNLQNDCPCDLQDHDLDNNSPFPNLDERATW